MTSIFEIEDILSSLDAYNATAKTVESTEVHSKDCKRRDTNHGTITIISNSISLPNK